MTALWKRTSAALALALASPPLAHAHLVSTGLGPIYDGITHFALSPEQLLPVLAFAVFAGLRGKDHARHAIFALPFTWLVMGFVGAAAGVAVPDALAWLPLLALGGLLASDLRLSRTATTAVAVVIGAALGYANGAAMAQVGAGIRGVVGSALALFVVVTLGAAGASAWQAGWIRVAWRVAGSWIAAGGLLLLGWSLK